MQHDRPWGRVKYLPWDEKPRLRYPDNSWVFPQFLNFKCDHKARL